MVEAVISAEVVTVLSPPSVAKVCPDIGLYKHSPGFVAGFALFSPLDAQLPESPHY